MIMRKYKKGVLIILLLGVVAFLGISIGNKLSQKKEVAERIQQIPNFSFNTIQQGASFNQNNISKSKPKLFIYFNSECDYCHAEAKQIAQNLSKLNHVQMVFVSYESVETAKTFAEKYNLLNKENITFLEDKKLAFETLFDAKSIPYMLLYSKDNQLIQKFKGATKIDKIIALLE